MGMYKLRDYSLEDIMNFPLPGLTFQKKLMYRPTIRDVHHVYDLLNEYVFRSELNKPYIEIAGYRRKYWGMCIGHYDLQSTGSYCDILLMDKFYCPQWMVAIIAHEMAHQHQWDVESPKRLYKGKPGIMSHGPTFFRFRDKLKKYSIPLKTAHSMRRWFKNQDMFK